MDSRLGSRSMGKKILFDTGPSRTFTRNAKLLGYDLTKVDMVILSMAITTTGEDWRLSLI